MTLRSILSLFSRRAGALGFLLLVSPGCEEACHDPLRNYAAECGLVCSNPGLAAGNSVPSYNVLLAEYFAQVLEVEAHAASLAARLETDRQRLASHAEVSPSAEPSDVAEAIAKRIASSFGAPATLTFSHETCLLDPSRALDLLVGCDEDVDEHQAFVSCQGECAPEPNAVGGASSSGPDEPCTTECRGRLTLPSASAECVKMAHSEVQLYANCDPGDPIWSLPLPSEANASQWLSELARLTRRLAADAARARLLRETAADFAVDATGDTEDGLDELRNGNIDLATEVAAACAKDELPSVVPIVAEANDSLDTPLRNAQSLLDALSQ